MQDHVRQVADCVVKDDLTALVDNQNLIIYDIKSKKVYNQIPLESIVRLESDLYKHNQIFDQQLPAVKLLYQHSVSPTMNQLKELIIKTTAKEWNLYYLLKSSIRNKILRLFYQSLEPDIVDFDQGCDMLIKTSIIKDKSIVADTCSNLVKSLIYQTCIDHSAKYTLFSTCIIDIIINEINQTFQWLKKSVHTNQVSNVPQWIILKKSGKEIAKMLPSFPSPTHPNTVLNSLYFSSLCLDWITAGIYDNDPENIKIPRLACSENESKIPSVDLVNDISDNLLLYQADDEIFNNFCTSLSSLASEIACNSTNCVKFTRPEFLCSNCMRHIQQVKSNSYNTDQDLLHAFRHCQLVYYLLSTFQITKSILKKMPEYRSLLKQSNESLPRSKEQIRLVTITNEILFQITFSFSDA